MSDRYRELQDVILDPSFPELDLALRRGRHIDRDDLALYTLLTDAQDHLETLYRRYGCELVHKADGYFYLLPTGEKLSRRQLGAGDMLVGQALALMYLDPATIERGGRATTEDVVAQLVVVLGSDALIRAFNPKRKRYDERVAQKTVRAKVAEGIRHLAALGFVDLDGEALRLRPALLRFAEPVRGLSAPAEALAKLVASGEVSLVEGEGAEASDAEDKDDFDDDRDGSDADEDDERPDDDAHDGAGERSEATQAAPSEATTVAEREADADQPDADDADAEPDDVTKAAVEAETDLDDRDVDNPDEQDDDW